MYSELDATGGGAERVHECLRYPLYAAVAQLVERVLGKDEVKGSSPFSSSSSRDVNRFE